MPLLSIANSKLVTNKTEQNSDSEIGSSLARFSPLQETLLNSFSFVIALSMQIELSCALIRDLIIASSQSRFYGLSLGKIVFYFW